MRALAALIALALLAACPEPAVDVDDVVGVAHRAAAVDAPDVVAPGIYLFATAPGASSSVLWHADPASAVDADGLLPRRAVLSAPHAAGVGPRGAVAPDGSHVAWLTLPEGGRQGGTADLFVDGLLVDSEALYLQRPRFVDGMLLYLRHHPGALASGPDGRLAPRVDAFDLVLLDPARPTAAPEVLDRHEGDWLQLCGSLPGPPGDPASGLLALRITAGEHELVEWTVDGRMRVRWRLGSNPIRDVRPHPDGSRRVVLLAIDGGDRASAALIPFDGGEASTLRAGLHRDDSPRLLAGGRLATTEGAVASGIFSVPQEPLAEGVLWREHAAERLDWVLRRPDGERLLLTPPNDDARDLFFVGRVR
jgi:hypothetical protein